MVPTTFTWPASGADDLDAALEALVDESAADPECSVAFPMFAQDVETAFARLRRTPQLVEVRDPSTEVTSRVPFSATDLAYATRGLLYGNDALSLPIFFAEAARGRYEAFAQAYVTRARRLDQEIARGVHLGAHDDLGASAGVEVTERTEPPASSAASAGRKSSASSSTRPIRIDCRVGAGLSSQHFSGVRSSKF